MTYLPSSEPFGTRLYYKQAYEELLVKWEAELQAGKNDYERIKQLEAYVKKLENEVIRLEDKSDEAIQKARGQ